MFPIEKAAVAAAAYMPHTGLFSLYPHHTTKRLVWQDLQNIFSNI